MGETTINKSQFSDLSLKGQLSVLYDNTEETKRHVRCLARKKENLVLTIIKWSAVTAICVYVLFQAVPIESALPLIKVILGG
ncbi:MAG TPA: hypothetical protein PLN56_11570 [Methanoregulaceae archaeon]|nr:hypothetical protein [Methanoregulaceae archaeon]